MVNRRQFVSTASVAIAATALSDLATALPAFAAPDQAGSVAPAPHWAAGWWQQRRRARVVLEGETRHVVEVFDVVEHRGSAELEQFTVSFRGPGDQTVPEGLYRVRIQGKRFQLHLQPGRTEQSASYSVAAVSRLL